MIISLNSPLGSPRTVSGPQTSSVSSADGLIGSDGGHRLQELLVGPSQLARLLVEVQRGRDALGHQWLEVVQQRRLARVARVPLAGERDVVDAQAAAPRRPPVQRQARLGVMVLGNREGDALERRRLQMPVAQLQAHPRVGAQRGGGSGEDAEEVRKLAAGRQHAAQQRLGALRCGQVVVDLEPAHGGLHRATGAVVAPLLTLGKSSPWSVTKRTARRAWRGWRGPQVRRGAG
jgi:hypothetical protein